MYIRSIEHKQKMSLACRGKNTWTKGITLSEEHKKKIGLSKIGKKRKSFSDEWRHNLSKSLIGKKGYPMTKEHKEKLRKINLGKKHSEEYKKKMSISCRGINSGKDNGNWKDGITKENIKIRSSVEYRNWQKACFKRDNHMCRKYGNKNGKFQIHHILNFCDHPELRFDINNGITLSVRAHKEFHKKYGARNNTREQIDEFLSNESIA